MNIVDSNDIKTKIERKEMKRKKENIKGADGKKEENGKEGDEKKKENRKGEVGKKEENKKGKKEKMKGIIYMHKCCYSNFELTIFLNKSIC